MNSSIMSMSFPIGEQTDGADIEVFPFEGEWVLYYSGQFVWEERYPSASVAMLRVATLIRSYEMQEEIQNFDKQCVLEAEQFLDQVMG